MKKDITLKEAFKKIHLKVQKKMQLTCACGVWLCSKENTSSHIINVKLSLVVLCTSTSGRQEGIAVIYQPLPPLRSYFCLVSVSVNVARGFPSIFSLPPSSKFTLR